MYRKYKAWAVCWMGIIFISTLYATAQNQTPQEDIAIASYYWERFQGVTVTNKITLSLKNNEVDISQVFGVINQLKKSEYAGDLQNMERLIDDLSVPDIDPIFQGEIIKLCEKSLSKDNCIEKAKNELETAFYQVVQEKEGQILYPEHYEDIYNSSKRQKDNVMVANSILDLECPHEYHSEVLSDKILNISPHQWAHLKDKLKSQNKNFLKNLLQNFNNKLQGTKIPKQCLDMANRSHRVCQKIRKNWLAQKQKFTYLAELVHGPDILKTTQAKAPCIDCLEGTLSEELNHLKQLFSVLKEQSLCSDPAKGEEKQVMKSGFPSASHTVRREQDGSFTIPLNLNFVADEDYDGEIPKGAVPAHYKNKVQECLKKANSKMLGPNGEKLKITIEPPLKKSACEKEQAKTIKIGSSKHRSNMGKYESDIDCPTITHEVLHLLGLCDEYKESLIGFSVSADTGKIKKIDSPSEQADSKGDIFVPAYDCRVTSKNNIMSNQYERWDSVFEGKTSASLLNKRQFNAILYGDCPSKNQLFNECSDLAYKSSVQEGHKDCLKQKRKCLESNLEGKDKEEELSTIRGMINLFESAISAINNDIKEEKTQSNPDMSKISRDESKRQEFASELKKLREELEIVSAWPDPPPPSAMP